MSSCEEGKINIMGIILDRLDYDGALKRIEDFLKSHGLKTIVTPNAEIIMASRTDEELRKAVNGADMRFPDGIGVVLASRIIGEPLCGRTAGYDLMEMILDMAARRNMSVFLLGGKPKVADEASTNIKSKFPGIKIAGTQHGYFDESEEEWIVDKINKSGTDILLVAMGAPKQEFFMLKNRPRLQCSVAMGVGGSLDVLAGRVQRAPVFMQKAGLEWLYRLVTQPSRIKRMSVLPLFLAMVILYKFGRFGEKAL
ncbi:MAG: WecB/TagA/CpsF family glycosyltransferase [Tepidanaerobacteraceae bacterium]|jgi:N-acetylglucosaminyldiphosphoundecaprenol N-acetyl-beta-D-mannosaminyltransferase|nr:WecB/TagA/CpsF family glycosyltransferase [Tepidanaerobacteraceae bacterium]